MVPVVTVKITKIGKAPVVLLPLTQWKKIEDMLEDYEMMRSENFRRSIAKARKEKKLYSPAQVRKILGL